MHDCAEGTLNSILLFLAVGGESGILIAVVLLFLPHAILLGAMSEL